MIRYCIEVIVEGQVNPTVEFINESNRDQLADQLTRAGCTIKTYETGEGEKNDK